MLQKLIFYAKSAETHNMITLLKEKNINIIEEKVRSSKSEELELDLSSMNILDASRAAVLSSAIFYGKHPEGRIKCRLQSENIKNFVAGLALGNIEFI